VVVEWEDAYSNSSWHTNEEIDRDFEDGGWQCKNIGLLVRDEKTHIVIASRWSDTNGSYGHLQRIPRGMVKKITTVKYV
jgi:hypothetical protein